MKADAEGGESTCSCVDSGDVSNWQDCWYSVDEIEDTEFGGNDGKTGFKSGELADIFSLET